MLGVLSHPRLIYDWFTTTLLRWSADGLVIYERWVVNSDGFHEWTGSGGEVLLDFYYLCYLIAFIGVLVIFTHYRRTGWLKIKPHVPYDTLLLAMIGVLVGFAKFVGSWLLTASLPAPAAVLEVLIHGIANSGLLAQAADPVAAESSVRQVLSLLFTQQGFGSGWVKLLALILVPLSYLLQWLYFGLAGHGIARLMGGTGQLNQTLGAVSLMAVPRILLVTTVLPFVSIGATLPLVWSLLIVYRALQISHGLSWQRAALATVILTLGFGFLMLLAGGAVALSLPLFLGGGA